MPSKDKMYITSTTLYIPVLVAQWGSLSHFPNLDYTFASISSPGEKNILFS